MRELNFGLGMYSFYNEGKNTKTLLLTGECLNIPPYEKWQVTNLYAEVSAGSSYTFQFFVRSTLEIYRPRHSTIKKFSLASLLYFDEYRHGVNFATDEYWLDENEAVMLKPVFITPESQENFSVTIVYDRFLRK